jgi:transcriptional regulator with XRE-family HTH domain
MLFKDRLRALREDADLTQSELAKAVNVTREAIKNYENGYRLPSVEILVSLSDYFNVTLDFLVGRTNKNIPFHK